MEDRQKATQVIITLLLVGFILGSVLGCATGMTDYEMADAKNIAYSDLYRCKANHPSWRTVDDAKPPYSWIQLMRRLHQNGCERSTYK